MIPILVGLAYYLVLLEVLILVRSYRFRARESRNAREPYAPRSVILAPHYGWDETAEQNARLLLDQQYDGQYEVYFITHDHEGGPDRSYEHLKRLTGDLPHCRVILAPNVVDHSLSRSQKVQNLLTAIADLDDEVEVLAFVDADARVKRDWLAHLVKPLKDRRIGATVGARYYAAQSLDLPTLVEAVWVNFQLFWQGDHSGAMVWGGSSAIRRELIRDGRIHERWSNAPFEDHRLTEAVRDLGQNIHFVPQCIVISETSGRTWRQVMEFTNRQILVTYRMGLREMSARITAAFLPKGLIVFGLLPWAVRSPGLLLALAAVPVAEWIAYYLAGRNLPRWLIESPSVKRTHILCSFICPLGMLLAIINVVHALFRSEIVWGGVRYLIPSPDECRIVGRESD